MEQDLGGKEMIEIVESRKATEEEMKQYAEKEAEKLIPEWKQRMLHVFLGGHYEKNQ